MESIHLRDTRSPRRLLVALAHPDDESFGPAGTLVRYAREGVAVHLACATRGEAGDVGPEHLDGVRSVADLRTGELLCASGHLGLAGVHFLDYQDSGMEGAPENQNPASLMQAPVDEVATKITRLIRQIQPQVVLTHDPSGGYFHPDHIKVHQAATVAFHSAGDSDRFPEQLGGALVPFQPQKLYYTAFAPGLLKLVTKILPLFGQNPEAFGRNHDINIKRMADAARPVTTKIRVSPYAEASQRAARCHASQSGGRESRVLQLLGMLLNRYDTFTRSVPAFEGGTVERDLFAGVDEPAASGRPSHSR